MPTPPAVASQLFGEQLPLAARYAGLLLGDGLVRGVLGPREAPRIWERHLLNCAAVAEVFPTGTRVVDVGSGAGLPGIVLAIARPDLRVELVDSLARRTRFLAEMVDALDLSSRVTVVTGRAELPDVRARVGSASWVTARAVAPLDRLAGWCARLLNPGGTLVAVKGSSADAEVANHAVALRRQGWSTIEVRRIGVGVLAEPTTVIVARRRGGNGPVRGVDARPGRALVDGEDS